MIKSLVSKRKMSHWPTQSLFTTTVFADMNTAAAPWCQKLLLLASPLTRNGVASPAQQLPKNLRAWTTSRRNQSPSQQIVTTNCGMRYQTVERCSYYSKSFISPGPCSGVQNEHGCWHTLTPHVSHLSPLIFAGWQLLDDHFIQSWVGVVEPFWIMMFRFAEVTWKITNHPFKVQIGPNNDGFSGKISEKTNPPGWHSTFVGQPANHPTVSENLPLQRYSPHRNKPSRWSQQLVPTAQKS